MKHRLPIRSLAALIGIMVSLILNGQVKTKIFDTKIPLDLLPLQSPVAAKITIKAPLKLDYLLQSPGLKEDKSMEYDNKFALPQPVSINFLTAAKPIEEKNNLVYSLAITAEKAMNLSAQFKGFSLSPNAVLSIYTENELTDSITAKENNKDKIWATRVYQGHTLNMALKVPKAEAGLSDFTISQISFGYKKYGADYFGTPGASAPCNINVLCPQGNGWENERNSVAHLLVDDGSGTCTGSMIMNTCNANTPYLLTANHCLLGKLSNWVFEYQYWSTVCTSNTGWREDIQFNGCTLKANNATTDFALVQLNTTPPASTNITYAGWNRSATAATNTVQIHHPAGDLMKISLDANAPVAVSWPGITGLTHWRAHFQQGTVQPGSSGSPLFDQNHRIIGQCHGDQNNANNYCAQQISECGRFNLSWTGGGTNSTRLSNWLDPTGTNAVTTNTTSLSNLGSLNPNDHQIVGPSQFCTSQTYSVSGVPNGATVSWYITPGSYFSYSQSNNILTVNRIADGDINITATLTLCGITFPPYAKSVRVGGNPITVNATQTACDATSFYVTGAASGATYNWSSANGTILYNGTSTTATTSATGISATTSAGTADVAVVNTTNSCSQSVFVSAQLQYTYPRQIDGVFDTYSNGDHVNATVNTTPFDSYYTWYINGVVDYQGASASSYVEGNNIVCGENTIRVEVTACGVVTSSDEVHFYKMGNCGYRSTISNVNAYPNPARNIVAIKLVEVNKLSKGQKNIESIKQIKVLNKFGKILKVYSEPLNTKLTTIDISSLPLGIYYIEVSDVKNYVMLPLSVQK